MFAQAHMARTYIHPGLGPTGNRNSECQVYQEFNGLSQKLAGPFLHDSVASEMSGPYRKRGAEDDEDEAICGGSLYNCDAVQQCGSNGETGLR